MFLKFNLGKNRMRDRKPNKIRAAVSQQKEKKKNAKSTGYRGQPVGAASMRLKDSAKGVICFIAKPVT